MRDVDAQPCPVYQGKTVWVATEYEQATGIGELVARCEHTKKCAEAKKCEAFMAGDCTLSD